MKYIICNRMCRVHIHCVLNLLLMCTTLCIPFFSK